MIILQVGLDRGLDQGFDRGLDQGFDRGLDQGLDQGLDRGLDWGFVHDLDKSDVQSFVSAWESYNLQLSYLLKYVISQFVLPIAIFHHIKIIVH